MTWLFPLNSCHGIPVGTHPGAFGAKRKHDFHTGVDLYCEEGQAIYAVEDGIVVKNDIFTGTEVGFPWWRTTWAVMIEGESGVVNYGELSSELILCDKIKRGDVIGNVKQVLFSHKKRFDIIGHNTSMLHVELYKPNSRDFALWENEKPENILDPTPFLIESNEKKFPIIEN